jgi:hypothetical protein
MVTKMDTRMSEAGARFNAFMRVANPKPADRRAVSTAYKRLSTEMIPALADFESTMKRASSATGCCTPTEPGEAEFYRTLFRRHPNMNTHQH